MFHTWNSFLFIECNDKTYGNAESTETRNNNNAKKTKTEARATAVDDGGGKYSSLY